MTKKQLEAEKHHAGIPIAEAIEIPITDLQAAGLLEAQFAQATTRFETHASDCLLACAKSTGQSRYRLTDLKLWPLNGYTISQVGTLIRQTTGGQSLSVPELAIVLSQAVKMPEPSVIILAGSTCGQRVATVIFDQVNRPQINKAMPDETGDHNWLLLTASGRQLMPPDNRTKQRRSNGRGRTRPSLESLRRL